MQIGFGIGLNFAGMRGRKSAPAVARGIFTADPALASTDTGNSNCNFRIVCTLADYMGPEFRVGILPGSSNALTANHVAAGRWAGNETTPDATDTLVEALYGGASGFTNKTAIQWSDWMPSGAMANQPAGTQVIVSYNTGGSAAQASQAFAAAPTNAVGFFKADTSGWQAKNVTGYTELDFNFCAAFIESRGGSPPPTPAVGYIPLTFDDAIFDRNTGGTNPVVITAGTSMVYRSIVEASGNPTFTFQDNTSGSFLAAESREGVRLGGDTTIQYGFFDSTGVDPDHADTIQIFAVGARGKTINVKNTYVKAHNTAVNAGFFCADDWGGAINLEYVVFDGGPYGLKITADPGCQIVLSLKDVYFITGSFITNPFVFQDNGTGSHVIAQWDNVRYATIVDGELVPGALIPNPGSTGPRADSGSVTADTGAYTADYSA